MNIEYSNEYITVEIRGWKKERVLPKPEVWHHTFSPPPFPLLVDIAMYFNNFFFKEVIFGSPGEWIHTKKELREPLRSSVRVPYEFQVDRSSRSWDISREMATSKQK